MNRVDNISCSGVLCRTAEPIPLMTKMSLVLELPGPDYQRIEAEGVVVRCDPHESSNGSEFSVAILYQNLDHESYAAIEVYVAQDLGPQGNGP